MTVLGLLLGAFGLVLLNFGNPPATSQAVETYSSTWKATELYRLNFSHRNGTGLTNLGGIGVKKWEVTGVVAGSPFTETWTGPAANTISFSESGGCRVNTDPKVWLGSCLWLDVINSEDSMGNYWLTEVAVESLVRQSQDNGWAYGGSGAFCSSSTPTLKSCWSTTGTYGFQRFAADKNGGVVGMPEYAGVMMPLQWNVTGTIQEDQ